MADEMNAPATTGDADTGVTITRPTLADRIRGYAPWIGAVVLLLAFLSAMKWWGDQQQRAALHGRAWPPVPVRVFLRGY